MSSQIQNRINVYPIERVSYAIHSKIGKPESLRVDYWHGLRVVCSEWVCFEHDGFAGAKAAQWWRRRMPGHEFPSSIRQAFSLASSALTPYSIRQRYRQIPGDRWIFLEST